MSTYQKRIEVLTSWNWLNIHHYWSKCVGQFKISWHYFLHILRYFSGFFWARFCAEIWPQSQSEFSQNFPKIDWKFPNPKFWEKKKCMIDLDEFFLCISCLQFIELIFIHWYTCSLLVLLLIFPILKPLAPVPKYWKNYCISMCVFSM